MSLLQGYALSESDGNEDSDEKRIEKELSTEIHVQEKSPAFDEVKIPPPCTAEIDPAMIEAWAAFAKKIQMATSTTVEQLLDGKWEQRDYANPYLISKLYEDRGLDSSATHIIEDFRDPEEFA